MDMPSLVIIGILIGIIVGGVVGWLIGVSRTRSSYQPTILEAEKRASLSEASTSELRRQLSEVSGQLTSERARLEVEQRNSALAQAALEAERRNLEEQRRLLDDAHAKLADVFRSLSSEVLAGQTESFLRLAKENFEKVRVQAEGDLGKRQEAIQGLVQPIKDVIGRIETEVRGMEEKRQRAYGSLEEHLRSLTASSEELRRQAGTLTTALKGVPQVRGKWGQLTLRRVAELAGMVEYCDFFEQETVQTDDGRLRPDMVVRLPAGRQVVVDAKVSLVAFLEAAEAETDEKRTEALLRHAQSVRQHMTNLSSRRYWEQFEPTPDFVICFLPGEAYFSAALQYDRTLIEDGLEKRVIIASPTTLIALLRAIAYGWRQEQVAKSAQEISQLGKELYARIGKLSEHFGSLRTALEKSVRAYNSAVGSLENRVMPTARKFQELGVVPDSEIAVLEPIDETPRRLSLPEASELESKAE